MIKNIYNFNYCISPNRCTQFSYISSVKDIKGTSVVLVMPNQKKAKIRITQNVSIPMFVLIFLIFKKKIVES